MATGLRALAFAAVLAGSVGAHATQLTNRSFEMGGGSLNGWDPVGDVSAQTAALGVTPTHGQYAALLTTANGFDLPNGYSGSFGLTNSFLDYFPWLGLSRLAVPPPLIGEPWPDDWLALFDWQSSIGAPDNFGATCCGFSAIRQSFDMRAGDVMSYDWNRVGDEVDGAFAFFYPTSEPFFSGMFASLDNTPLLYRSGMDLAAVDPFGCGNQAPLPCGFETGWQHSSFVAPTDGSYTVVVGVANQFDGSYLSALWLDNFKISPVPEPGSLALLGVAFLGLVATRRRKTSG